MYLQIKKLFFIDYAIVQFSGQSGALESGAPLL